MDEMLLKMLCPRYAELTDVERNVIEALIQTGGECGGCGMDGRWTNTVKRLLHQRADTFSLKQYAAYTDNGTKQNGECLWDLSWRAEDDGKVSELVLALESEWGNKGEILKDFRKLPMARARHRVMVFEHQGDQVDIHTMADQFKNEIRHFSPREAGDRYLFACWYPKMSPKAQDVISAFKSHTLVERGSFRFELHIVDG